MKSLFYGIILMIICGSTCEAQVYGEIRPMQYFQPVPVYYYAPQVIVVPVVALPVQYVPITTYSNVVVEKQHWCLFKKYEVVPVANTVYLPVNLYRNY